VATYYVRKSGNDGNGGESAGDAWLTIDKAANEVAAGDTVYIGAGLYREQVTMDTSGTSGNQISFIGDIDGVQTGDAGPVVISAFSAATGVGPARTSCLDLNAKEFFVWQYVDFFGGSTAAIEMSAGSSLALEADTGACTVDGIITYAIVSV